MTVHDELIAERMRDALDGMTPEKFHDVMCADVPWQAGLPLAAEVKTGLRYG